MLLFLLRNKAAIHYLWSKESAFHPTPHSKIKKCICKLIDLVSRIGLKENWVHITFFTLFSLKFLNTKPKNNSKKCFFRRLVKQIWHWEESHCTQIYYKHAASVAKEMVLHLFSSIVISRYNIFHYRLRFWSNYSWSVNHWPPSIQEQATLWEEGDILQTIYKATYIICKVLCGFRRKTDLIRFNHMHIALDLPGN